jgi:hypothetical protein
VYTENSDSRVLVVQFAKDRVRYDASHVMNWAGRRYEIFLIEWLDDSTADVFAPEVTLDRTAFQ